MELFYGRSRHPEMEGRAFRNARLFSAAEEGAKKVLVDGDYPAITKAYAAAGVEVSRVDPLVATPATVRSLPPHEPGAVVIPDDWRDLPWTQKTGDDGMTLRSLASAISDAPVVNKADAVAVIEAETERRG